MNKKLIPVFVLIVLIVGAGAFFGGMKYGQTKNKTVFGRGDFPDMANGQRPGGAQFGQGGAKGFGGGMVNGTILAMDDKTITVSVRTPGANGAADTNAGSKIILFSGTTQIMKSTTGVIGDLKVGDNLVVTGKTNTDGSVSAESIQLRPVVAAPAAPAQPVK